MSEAEKMRALLREYAVAYDEWNGGPQTEHTGRDDQTCEACIAGRERYDRYTAAREALLEEARRG